MEQVYIFKYQHLFLKKTTLVYGTIKENFILAHSRWYQYCQDSRPAQTRSVVIVPLLRMVSWCCHNTSAVKAPMFSAPKTMLVYACFSNSNANSNSSKALDIPTYSERKTKVSVTAFNTSCASLATFVRKTPTGYTMLLLFVDFIFAIVFLVADCFVQRKNLRRSANTCRIRSERNRHQTQL